MVSINKDSLIKGIVFTLILMIGTLIGVIMRTSGANGYFIFAVVAIVNIITALLVFKMLQKIFIPAENEVQKSLAKKKNEDLKTESDK